MSHLPEKQKRYLSQAVQLEEAVNPQIVKATMTMISLAILVFVIWAGLTNINEVARAPGEVIPEGRPQTVQHLEGGIVREIFVRDGQRVEAGAILLTLDGAGTSQDLERALKTEVNLALEEERLRAMLEDRAPDWSDFKNIPQQMIRDQESFYKAARLANSGEESVLKNQIQEKRQALQGYNVQLASARENAEIAGDLYARHKRLNMQGYSSDMKLMNARTGLNAAEAEAGRLKNMMSLTHNQIREYQSRLDAFKARARDDISRQLEQVSADRAQNDEIVTKLKNKTTRLDVRAPSSGIVNALDVNTIGEIIPPGATLMEIVPEGKNLIVEVRIPPRHIGHLHTGQNVQVKFSSFDFSRYGSVSGILRQISATSFNGENGERYYEGLVTLSQNHVGEDPSNIIIPGMTVMADIITGRKTILDYLLKPIQRATQTAFTER